MLLGELQRDTKHQNFDIFRAASISNLCKFMPLSYTSFTLLLVPTCIYSCSCLTLRTSECEFHYFVFYTISLHLNLDKPKKMLVGNHIVQALCAVDSLASGYSQKWGSAIPWASNLWWHWLTIDGSSFRWSTFLCFLACVFDVYNVGELRL